MKIQTVMKQIRNLRNMLIKMKVLRDKNNSLHYICPPTRIEFIFCWENLSSIHIGYMIKLNISIAFITMRTHARIQISTVAITWILTELNIISE